MSDTGYYLAQINVGRIRAPLSDPLLAGFVEQLGPINALAEASPGFIWRLQTPEGDATSINVFDDDLIIINMSVWQSLEALHDYVYRSQHSSVLRQRKEWFEPYNGPFMALWWVPSDKRPTPQQGKERIEHLAQHGPTPTAFTFKTTFPPPATL
jgi:hypothetical protein